MKKKSSSNVVQKMSPPLRWVPIPGEFTTTFLTSKSLSPNGPSYDDLSKGKTSVLAEAQSILGRFHKPNEIVKPETGLVVGYVQSGKTLSFETVISLARDNGYGLIVVLAGVKLNLLDQTGGRLLKDFGMGTGNNKHWYHIENPVQADKDQLKNKVSAWVKSPHKKTVLVTVLKHAGWLEKLADVLGQIDLKNVPSLIIDDESDQAGLNINAAGIASGTKQPNDFSAIYRSIVLLRSKLPCHAYLQYTATPQAMLLLNKSDTLNPNFAELVTPGNSYTGGDIFFGGSEELIVDIPASQVGTKNSPLTSAPKTLLEAYRSFLLVAAHHSLTLKRAIKTSDDDLNRSMMVHPGVTTSSHKEYKTWIDRANKQIRKILEQTYKTDLSTSIKIFQKEFDSLLITYPPIRPLPELIYELVNEVFDELHIVEINGTKDALKKIDWTANRYWVLVGGANLDRGFTVEGLCTTYMPRPLGNSPSADSLQQRARFFGYKLKYLGLCRVYVQSNTRVAFREYIEHEKFIRSILIKHRGFPLSSWKRDFILTSLLNPTRKNVIGLNIRNVGVKGWIWPKAMQNDDDSVKNNRLLFSKVIKKWEKSYGIRVNAALVLNGTTSSPHQIIQEIPLKDILEDFLFKISVRDIVDSEVHNASLIALSTLLSNNSSLLVDVFLMNDLNIGYRSRVAGHGYLTNASPFAPINQYFSQSANSLNDSNHCFPNRISLQLRYFDLGIHQRDPVRADIRNVPWFAMHIPLALQKQLIIEKI